MLDTKQIAFIALTAITIAGLSTQAYYLYTTPSFDPQLAIDIDYYSKVSYCDVDAIQKWNCGDSCNYHSGMTDVQAFNKKTKEAQGYCGYDASNKRIVVAYRGSSNIQNWIANFQAIPVKYAGCQGCLVHDGFQLTLKEISDNINTCVQGLANKYQDAQVFVTGHSLGGALATLSVLEIAKIVDPSKIVFMNFGSPRVGNQQFVEYFDSVITNGIRVVNFKDIVPHLPLKIMDFKHVNTEVWMLSNGAVNDYKVCPTEEDPQCSDSVKLPNAADHTNYFGFYTGC
ncbi:lipase family protein (macronuclear) [Tetrahymena thermophila SB210]|uniref:Lipase family protein n=1 Tax=Tetrahymena thermophila (strain SB210) TaxID=312017 RepID=I7MLP8_TETTS|nr:lipase family protein [Tetrahymena thermophila SB210]EAS02832.1 lipase family protein [Tetrahymena thermophila SB210]|eukprot:XP_001023077.1 lipase family protein [Tetrahymena thermophila SB210]